MEASMLPSQFVFTHVFVLLGAVGLSWVLGERFLLMLFSQFLLCKTIGGSKNPSLSAAIILCCILMVELSILQTLIPALWSSLSQIIYLFLAHAYLGHYFVWCIRIFGLVDQDSEVLELLTYSSFPVVCVISISLVVHSITSWNLSLILCLQGFVTLWICSRYRPVEQLEELWSFCMGACNLFLLRILPLAMEVPLLFRIISEANAIFVLTRFCFTFSWTCFLSGLLPLHDSISGVGNLKSSTSLALTLISGIVLLLNNHFISELVQHRFGSVVWIIPQTVLFVGMLSAILIASRSSHSNFVRRIFQLISLLFGALFFIFYLIPLELSFGIPSAVGYKRFLSRAPFTLGFSTLCTIVALLAYALEERDLFEASLVFGIYAFHYVEWQLYEAMVLLPSHVVCSSILFGFGAFVLYVCSQSHKDFSAVTKHLCRRQSIRPLFSRSLMRLTALIPALTKLTLLCWNYTDWIGVGPDAPVDHVVSRVRFERSTIVGVFLIYLGLLMGPRLFRIASRTATAGCASISNTRYVQIKQIRNPLAFVLFVTYFALALYCIWSPLVRSKFGVLPKNYALVWPLAVLLACVSITGLNREKTLFHVDPNQLRAQIARGAEASFAFLWFVVLSGRIMDCGLSVLFACALFVVGLFLLLDLVARIIPNHGPDSTGIQYSFPAHDWSLLSIRLGMWCGFVLLTFLLWQGAIQLSDRFIMVTLGFSTCLAALIVLLLPQHYGTHEDSVSTTRNDELQGQIDPEVINLSTAVLSASDLRTPDPIRNANLPLFVNFPKTTEMTRCLSQLRVIISLSGFAFLSLMWIVHESIEVNNSDRPLLALLAVCLFVLVQTAVGCPRFITLRASDDASGVMSSDWYLQSGDCSTRLLIGITNFSVMAVILCLYSTFLWTHSDIEVLFLPCFLFGLTGRWFNRHRLFAPLFGFTIILLCSAWWQSHFYLSSHPPLPTFDRAVFRVSYSKWHLGIETALTVFLLPVHGLFLADQADWTTEQLLSFFVPRQLLIASTHAHKESQLCSLCIWLRAAHLLSHFYALTLCATHVLALACLAYVLVASSFASVLYGLYSFCVCIYILLRVDVVTHALST